MSNERNKLIRFRLVVKFRVTFDNLRQEGKGIFGQERGGEWNSSV